MSCSKKYIEQNFKEKISPALTSSLMPIDLTKNEDGTESLSFFYTTAKGSCKYAISVVPDFKIEDTDRRFREKNALYPKALLPYAKYKGKRWFYENECNRMGWMLAASNPYLQGHLGLLQTAVVSLRNAIPDLRSRNAKRLLRIFGSSSHFSTESNTLACVNPLRVFSSSINSLLCPKVLENEIVNHNNEKTIMPYTAAIDGQVISDGIENSSNTIMTGNCNFRDTSYTIFSKIDLSNKEGTPISVELINDEKHKETKQCSASSAKIYYLVLEDPVSRKKLRLKAAFERVKFFQISDSFCREFRVFESEVTSHLLYSYGFNTNKSPFSIPRIEDEYGLLGKRKTYNIFAFKLAFLNHQHFNRRILLLQRAVDAYRQRLGCIGYTNLCMRPGKSLWMEERLQLLPKQY